MDEGKIVDFAKALIAFSKGSELEFEEDDVRVYKKILSLLSVNNLMEAKNNILIALRKAKIKYGESDPQKIALTIQKIQKMI